MLHILIMFALTMLQSASFTLVSRARNTRSIWFHGIAAILSNGVYILVLKRVVMDLKSSDVQLAYVCGSTTGAMIMHTLSMKFLERGKRRIG